MCAPCVVILNGCGFANSAAQALLGAIGSKEDGYASIIRSAAMRFFTANEAIAETFGKLTDYGKMSATDRKRVRKFCEGYKPIAKEMDILTDKILINEVVSTSYGLADKLNEMTAKGLALLDDIAAKTPEPDPVP